MHKKPTFSTLSYLQFNPLAAKGDISRPENSFYSPGPRRGMLPLCPLIDPKSKKVKILALKGLKLNYTRYKQIGVKRIITIGIVCLSNFAADLIRIRDQN